MADRFEELLAKGKTGKLTPAESEELALFLNGPILDGLENPATEFVLGLKASPRMPTSLFCTVWIAEEIFSNIRSARL